MKIRLILNDKEYLEAFKDIALRTDDNLFIEVGNQGNNSKERVVVITDYAPEELHADDYSNIVFLSDNPGDRLENFKADTPLRLFKYNSLSSILADIHQINFVLSSSHGRSYDVLSDIFAVATDSFGIQSSEVTKIIARQILFHNSEKILIISLKAVNEYGKSDEGDRSRFTRLRYYQEIDRAYSIEQFVYKDNYGIYYLRLPDGLNPIAFMSNENIEDFIRMLSYDGFSTIILDIGNELNMKNIEIAKKSDRIIFYSENREMKVLDDCQLENESRKKLDILNLNISDDRMELKIDSYVEGLLKSHKTNSDEEKN